MNCKSILVFSFLVISGLSLRAQTTFGIHGSYVDVRDSGDALGFGAVLTLPLGEVFFVEARGGVYDTVKTTRESGPVLLDVESDLTPLELGLGMRAAIGPGADLYVSGGVYFMRLDSDFSLNGQPVPIQTENNEGWYALAGISTGTDLQLYVEVQYRTSTVKFRGGESLPVPLMLEDSDVHKVSANVGIRFRW
ncbi:MAG: outer membrane beta-barrel protein [Verrucomicrobia bacterium]|nr:outer membrane beta-barrel protein [Verrucomicrobiota bacterium]MCH8527766.1 outer membrane beta-barrel protein [Kiritimatiellia bacterium]